MNSHRVSLLLVCGLMMLFQNHASARTWTNSEGKTVEAEAVAKSDKTVTLKLPNGKTTEIAITKLSLDDQAFLKTWTPPKPKRPINVPEKAVYHSGSWFHVVLEEMPWKQARQKAEKMGGHLAIVKDAETDAVIVKLADGLLLWLGATDEEVDGLWKWVDGEKLDFKSWGATEPNGGRQENYLRLGVRGKWIDVDERGGGNGVVGFIVQWD